MKPLRRPAPASMSELWHPHRKLRLWPRPWGPDSCRCTRGSAPRRPGPSCSSSCATRRTCRPPSRPRACRGSAGRSCRRARPARCSRRSSCTATPSGRRRPSPRRPGCPRGGCASRRSRPSGRRVRRRCPTCRSRTCWTGCPR